MLLKLRTTSYIRFWGSATNRTIEKLTAYEWNLCSFPISLYADVQVTPETQDKIESSRRFRTNISRFSGYKYRLKNTPPIQEANRTQSGRVVRIVAANRGWSQIANEGDNIAIAIQ